MIEPNELYHHGIKGMKWGVRKRRELTSGVRQSRDSAKAAREQSKQAKKAAKQYKKYLNKVARNAAYTQRRSDGTSTIILKNGQGVTGHLDEKSVEYIQNRISRNNKIKVAALVTTAAVSAGASYVRQMY